MSWVSKASVKPHVNTTQYQSDGVLSMENFDRSLHLKSTGTAWIIEITREKRKCLA